MSTTISTPVASTNQHALENTWAFWEVREGNNKKDYSNNVRLLGEFATIEKFWEYWLSIPNPSEVFADSSRKVFVDGREIKALVLFKKNITPEWEDKANADGSQLEAFKYLSSDALNVHWENLVLGLIGETIDENDSICGARLVNQNKKGKVNCKFEVWLRRKDTETANKIKANLVESFAEGNEKVKLNFRFIENDFTHNNRVF